MPVFGYHSDGFKQICIPPEPSLGLLTPIKPRKELLNENLPFLPFKLAPKSHFAKFTR
jgi:hypothetical protein